MASELDAARALAFWRTGPPSPPLFPSPAAPPTGRSGAGGGSGCRPPPDPALHASNPPPHEGTLATPPPPEVMANEASSHVNRRIELALLHNEVQAAQSLLAVARALGGGGGGGGEGGGAASSLSLLARLAPDPAFRAACASVGVPAAAFAAAAAAAAAGGGEGGGDCGSGCGAYTAVKDRAMELDLIKKLSLVLTQMKMPPPPAELAHSHDTRGRRRYSGA